MRTWLLLAVVVLVSERAHACMCTHARSASDALTGKEESTVFTGGVVGTIKSESILFALVRVNRAWAGAPFTLTLVMSPPSSGMCGWPMVRGEEYLFVTKNHLTTTCSGTELLSSATKTLEAIGPGGEPTPLAFLFAPIFLALFVALGLRMRRLKKR